MQERKTQGDALLAVERRVLNLDSGCYLRALFTSPLAAVPAPLIPAQAPLKSAGLGRSIGAAF